ncbi:MAG: hypothetical protein J2P23_09580, partial [Microlunatus sp.]|nr:hypothetical protein [Microlunatus sp.]
VRQHRFVAAGAVSADHLHHRAPTLPQLTVADRRFAAYPTQVQIADAPPPHRRRTVALRRL